MAIRKKRKSNNWLLWLLIILVILGVLFAIVGKRIGWIGSDGSIKVAVEKATLRTIIETVKANGKIYPSVEVKISPDVSGEIRSLNIVEGAMVNKGDLLAVIDADVYRSMVDKAVAAENNARSALESSKANLASLKTNVASLEARVLQAQAQVDQALADYERSEQLFNQKVVSKVDYENSETRYNTSLADLEAAKQAVEGAKQNIEGAKQNIEGAGFTIESAKANVKESRDNLNRTNIFAPMTGMVSLLNVKQGERVVGTAQMTGTEMLRIADFENMEVRVDVSENDVVRVTRGDTAVIEVDAYTDREFKGIVDQIASSAQGVGSMVQNEITNFTVKVLILKESYADLIKDNNITPFRPGMSASVEIQTKRVDDVLTVPIQAVTTRSASGDTLKTAKDIVEVVFTLDSLKTVKTKVKTGIQDETYIEIIDGLEEDQAVITAPFRTVNKKFKGDEKVKVVEKKELFKSTK